jgi:hypothetical protein
MGKPAVPGMAKPLKRPEDYYAASEQSARYADMLSTTSGERQGAVTQRMMANAAKIKQQRAEEQYGYKLDASGKRVAAQAQAAAPAPSNVTPIGRVVSDSAARAPMPEGKATDTAAPFAQAPTPAPAPAPTPAQAEIAVQKTEQDTLDTEATRRTEQTKRRGRGLSAFLTSGWQGVQQSALSKLLGA